jgi:hypothetical protein
MLFMLKIVSQSGMCEKLLSVSSCVLTSWFFGETNLLSTG